MLNEESKTLRTFSTSVLAKNGDKLDIGIGYDMTNAGVSGYVMMVSINGSVPSMSKKSLSRVKSLGVVELNMLIDSIGTDVTGAPYDYVELGMELIEQYIAGKASLGKLLAHYRIISDKQEHDLQSFIEAYKGIRDTGAPHKITTLINKYHKSNLIRFIDMSRDTLIAFHSLVKYGYIVNGTKYTFNDENIANNKQYRKRDVDYIRKARIRLFDKVLKRKYKPYGEV